MMMNFKKVAGAGIAAVTLSLMSTSAMAAFSANTTTYATQAITGAGAVSIPTGAIVYTTDANPTSTGTFTITFTLPTGVTFTSAPAFTGAVTGGTVSATLSGGGVGSNTATYVISVAGGPFTSAVSLTTSAAFGITGATALSSPTANGKFLISEQITATTVGGIPIQPAAGTTVAQNGTLASSTSALASPLVAAAPGAAIVVDVTTAGVNGTKFLSGGTDNIYGDIGALTFTIGGTPTVLAANGTSAYAFNSTTLSETLTGNTGGYTSAYLAPNATAVPACATTASAQAAIAGTIAGTISSTGITFPGIPVTSSGTAREVCLYTNGTTLLSAQPSGFTVSATIDTTTVTTPGLLAFNFNGTASSFYYVVNTSSSYASYIRIVNTSATTPVTVFASVTSDAGATGTAQVETSLAANANDLVPVSTITSNAGLTTTAGRYSITLFSGAGTKFETLLLNPGGVVSQIQ
jgi:hypothetical protein